MRPPDIICILYFISVINKKTPLSGIFAIKEKEKTGNEPQKLYWITKVINLMSRKVNG